MSVIAMVPEFQNLYLRHCEPYVGCCNVFCVFEPSSDSTVTKNVLLDLTVCRPPVGPHGLQINVTD